MISKRLIVKSEWNSSSICYQKFCETLPLDIFKNFAPSISKVTSGICFPINEEIEKEATAFLQRKLDLVMFCDLIKEYSDEGN